VDVVTLVEALLEDGYRRRWLSTDTSHLRARLDAIVAAARADIDVERMATLMHEQPVGEALHEYEWAMRYPSGSEGRGAECRPCLMAARALAAAYREADR
jgi:hypothetical protein